MRIKDHAKFNKTTPQAIPENVELVKLKQIMEEPATYTQGSPAGGQFAGICCESDFLQRGF